MEILPGVYRQSALTGKPLVDGREEWKVMIALCTLHTCVPSICAHYQDIWKKILNKYILYVYSMRQGSLS